MALNKQNPFDFLQDQSLWGLMYIFGFAKLQLAYFDYEMQIKCLDI